MDIREIDIEYSRVKRSLGHRPSRVEMFENMNREIYLDMKKKSKENIFKDYIGYLEYLNELEEYEIDSLNSFCREFLNMIENTVMSKSYKMPFLLSFYNGGDLKESIDNDDLYNNFRDFYSKEEHAIDMYADKNTKEFKKWSKEEYIDIAKKNPVKYMIKSESKFFKLDGEKIVVKGLEKFSNNKFFIENIKDAINFRIKQYYSIKDNDTMDKNIDCIFCNIEEYVLENDLAFAIYDKFPVSKGHMIFIPKRHTANFFDLTEEERNAIFKLIDKAKELLDLDKDNKPDGYNIGVNIGEYSGQSVMHVHVHLIPRYIGDTKYPKGGVRGVIPKKMSY